MNAINLTIVDDKVKVVSPYHEKFVERARKFRGTWKNGAWWFDDSIIDYVREVMIECFGTTGEEDYEECDLLIKNFTDYGDKAPVCLFGRTIARAKGRDSGAELGDGIILISGDCYSSGSVKNWNTTVSDATFLIKKFPIPALNIPEVKKAIEEGWCEVRELKKKRSVEDITADIKKYEQLLVKLQKELDDVQHS